MTKVQLGSGNRYEEDWVNVDLYAERADVREDICTVDFPLGSVETVRCIHTIEHIKRLDAIALFRRAARWLESGGTFEIETPDRKKCMNLIFHEQAYLLGAKGLLGGRSVDKPGWHKWLESWAQNTPELEARIKEFNIGKVEIPSRWELPGERHLYVWEGNELAADLHAAGFYQTKVGDPKHHGGRAWRDCRVIGIKK